MKVPVGTTFIVVASLLSLVAIVQLVAVLVYFGPTFVQHESAPRGQQVASAKVEIPVEETAPIEEAEKEAPAKPVENKSDEERIAELMKEADKLEASSSPGDALIPLEEAVSLQARNPEILSRVASLHERLGHVELAQDGWKSVLDLGPDAGRYLDVAEIRLRLLKQDSAATSVGSLELRDQIGLQPGSTFGIVDLKKADSNEGGMELKTLRLAVKSRPGEHVDAHDVRINVTFYEMLDGEIIPTTSRVQSMWYTSPVDWNEDGIEILEVKYEVPRLGADGGPAPRYYGYMVNIYYHGQLQETRADPIDLQDLFPPALNETPDFESQMEFPPQP